MRSQRIKNEANIQRYTCQMDMTYLETRGASHEYKKYNNMVESTHGTE